MSILKFTLAWMLLLGPLVSQIQICPYNPIIQSYGQGCNTAFLNPPSLVGSFDPVACSLNLSASTFPGCCNTYLVQRVLLLGLTPDNTTVAAYPSCTLLVVPDLAMIPITSDPMVFPLPSGISPVTVYAQAGFVYFTTIGFNYDLALTSALAITIQ